MPAHEDNPSRVIATSCLPKLRMAAGHRSVAQKDGAMHLGLEPYVPMALYSVRNRGLWTFSVLEAPGADCITDSLASVANRSRQAD